MSPARADDAHVHESLTTPADALGLVHRGGSALGGGRPVVLPAWGVDALAGFAGGATGILGANALDVLKVCLRAAPADAANSRR